MKAFSPFFKPGIAMISAALCADAVIGNVQEKAMKAHQASNNEVVSVLQKVTKE